MKKKENRDYSKEHYEYLRKIKIKKITILTIQIAILVAFFGFWELLTRLKVIDGFIMSSPSRIINTIGELYRSGTLFYHIGVTLYESVLAFIIATGVGFIIAVLLWWSEYFRRISEPNDKILLLKSMGANKFQIFFKLILPNSIPEFISVLKINVGMTWVGTIMGEYLVSRAGLGYLIVYGGQVFKLDLVMTGTVILCVLAAIMYSGVALLEKRFKK